MLKDKESGELDVREVGEVSGGRERPSQSGAGQDP
jgi:hypothetical protein